MKEWQNKTEYSQEEDKKIFKMVFFRETNDQFVRRRRFQGGSLMRFTQESKKGRE